MPVDVEARTISNRQVSDDYAILALEAPEIARLVEPGQFVMVRTSDGLNPLLRRPFSVFEILRDERGHASGFSLLVKRIGPGTARLYAATADQVFSCLGPLGRPFTFVDPPTEAWMVAGGVGLAPFVTLAEQLHERRSAQTLFYGGRRKADLVGLELFERLGVRLVLATEDGSCGAHGRITEPLEREIDARDGSSPLMLYACGPEPMLAAVARLAAAHGHPSEIATERTMGCGMGGCFSCVVRVRGEDGQSRYVRSCLEGPVFRGEDIVWE